MRFYRHTLITLLSTLAFCTVSSVQAQSYKQFMRGPKKIEIGYSFCMSSANYTFHATTFNENTVSLVDTLYREKIRTKGGFGATVGTYFPVAPLGEKGCMAISLAYMYNALLWEGSSFSYSSNSQTGTTSSGSGTVEMALPVGVDYKFGCDALLDKSKRFCYTLGAGVYPSLTATVYKDYAGAGFHVLPYLKGEVGIFAGICMKVRATYAFGNIKYINFNENYGNGQSETTLKGKSALTLSLILMPFSWKWERQDWWR